MCGLIIILHIVSLSVVLAFTPGISCTTICCALRTRSYCTHYRWIWFPYPLIWDKCSISCAVLNDVGWSLELVRLPVKCHNCEWPVSHLAMFVALRNSDVHMEWSKQGPVPSRYFVASLSYVLQSLALFSDNNKCLQGSAVNYSMKEPHLPTVCFTCRGVQAAHLIMTAHTIFFLVVKCVHFLFSSILVCLFFRNTYCFRQEVGWNVRFVLFHRANQSVISGFQLHGQSVTCNSCQW